MDNSFEKKLKEVLNSKAFIRFDSFLIREMGFQLVGNDEDDAIRKEALKEFRKRTKNYEFVTAPTLRKWFGIGGYSKPSRDIIIEICFALGVGKEKTAEYLTKGLGEPSFQINDYQEMVFLYGLEHDVSYENCLKMIDIFEENLDNEILFSKTHSTRELFTQYQKTKDMDMQAFIFWMTERADWFRGYSVTTLDYMVHYRTAIIEYIRKDAKEYLEYMLTEAGYYRWVKLHGVGKKNTKDSIQKFVNRKDKTGTYYVSIDDRKSILEMTKLAYSEKDTNVQILAEVFSVSDNVIQKNDTGRYDNIRKMSGKYISDLFNVPVHKEHSIKVAQALRTLKKMGENEECPEWINNIAKECIKHNESFENVKEAYDILNSYAKEHKRRTILIKRGDILPLVFHLSQRRYMSQHEDEYDMETAKQSFLKLADATLVACNMEKVNAEYELDMALLACFQEDDMYQYSDVLDVIYSRE